VVDTPVLLPLVGGVEKVPGVAASSDAGLLAALPGSLPTLEGDPGADFAPEGSFVRGVSGI